MPKSEIIKGLATGAISLDSALMRLLVIASDIDNSEISLWAERELNGYESNVLLPKYRLSYSNIFTYTGIDGLFQVKNSPLPLQNILTQEELNKWAILKIYICDGIKTVEDIAKSKRNIRRDLTQASGLVEERCGIRCISITQVLPYFAYEVVVNTLKTMLLKIFLELEKTYGCLDGLDIDPNGVQHDIAKKTAEIIYNYIHNDYSITIGDENKISDSRIFTGTSGYEEKD